MERTERIEVRIKPVLKKRLLSDARKQKVSVSHVIRSILVSHYDGSEMKNFRGGGADSIEPSDVPDALS